MLFLKMTQRENYLEPAHITLHLNYYISATGKKLGLRLCLSVWKIWRRVRGGGGAKGWERDREDEKKTLFVVIARASCSLCTQARQTGYYFIPLCLSLIHYLPSPPHTFFHPDAQLFNTCTIIYFQLGKNWLHLCLSV